MVQAQLEIKHHTATCSDLLSSPVEWGEESKFKLNVETETVN